MVEHLFVQRNHKERPVRREQLVEQRVGEKSAQESLLHEAHQMTSEEREQFDRRFLKVQ